MVPGSGAGPLASLMGVTLAVAPSFAAPARSPADLPGLVLWLDAADPASLVGDARGVREWRDKSGRGHHVGQPDPAARPAVLPAAQNGLALLSFDGARTYLTGPAVLPAGHGAYTVIAIWRPRRSGGVQSIFEQAEVPLRAHSRAALLAVGDRYGFNGESNDRHDLVPFEPKAWRLSCLEVDNAHQSNLRLLDNGLVHIGASGDPAALRLGAGGVTVGRKLATDNEYLDGEIAEILVFDRVLAEDERREVLDALDRKWGFDVLGWFHTPDGRVLSFDFDGEDYGEWTVEGTAFGSGPARGTLPNQMEVTGFLGAGLVNSYHGGDGSVGTLTSPPFVIERRYIRFLIGGGKYPGTACIDLLVDGQVVRTATGPNDRPGGSERLDWEQWDTTELIGRTAVIRIVDRETGGWGHINIDHIIQTDRRLVPLVDQSRQLLATARYLNFPVRDGAPKRRVQVIVEGNVQRDFVIPLADAEPDYWVFMDLVPFRGRTITVRAERVPEDSGALAAVEQGETIKGAEDLYRERLRPQFHFTSRRGWNNDPNGLVYHAGEWHLFYQHNPYSTRWDNMHWGHAVSPDLVHWQELPVALYPDHLGPCFSGSAVVDLHNTAGFSNGDEPAMVCIYTSAGNPCVQSLAYSTDRGRSWTKYPDNPVLGHVAGANRDPKVIWYAPKRQWVMALYLDQHDYGLFESPDLKQWSRLDTVTIPGTTECPEFFEIPIEGRPDETRWLFYGGNGGYLVGRFDGRQFTPEAGPHRMQQGNCWYASQTFNGAPDGRRILIAWGTRAMPGMPFGQMMTFPVELTLRETAEGLRLFAWPVHEIETLVADRRTFADLSLEDGVTPLAGVEGELFDLELELEPGEAREIGFVVRGVPVTYNVATGQLTAAGATAALALQDGRIRLRALIDRCSLELFGNGGVLYMALGPTYAEADRTLALFAHGGAGRASRVEVRALRSAWADPTPGP